MGELHSCRFCGGRMTVQKAAVADGAASYNNWIVKCEKCGCSFSLPGDGYYGRGFFKTQEAVIFAFNVFTETGSWETYGLTKADCNHCAYTRGSLKCCDIVDNKFQFHCEAGKRQYEENRYIDRYALMEAFDKYPSCDPYNEIPWQDIIWAAPAVKAIPRKQQKEETA